MKTKYILIPVLLFITTILRAQSWNGIGSGTAHDPYMIGTSTQLDEVRNFLGPQHAGKHFALSGDIDLKGNNWEPIGNAYGDSSHFYGNFNGRGYGISSLYISTPDSNYVGLFGYTHNARIENLILEFKDGIEGNHYVGALIGYCYTDGFEQKSIIRNITVKGTITASGDHVGGLIGANMVADLQNVSTIENCNAKITINAGGSNVGGLVGFNKATGSGVKTEVNNCFSEATIYGGIEFIGGLIGFSGAYQGATAVVEKSHSIGEIEQVVDQSTYSVGGLVGGIYADNNASAAIVRNSYTQFVVEATQYAGGICGSIEAASATSEAGVYNCYTTEIVNGQDMIGAIVGENKGLVRDCYYLSGICPVGVGSGDYYDNVINVVSKKESEMKSRSAFANWNFDELWQVCETKNYPSLKSQKGDGSECFPYEIYDRKDLYNLRNYTGKNYAQSHFKMMKDIVLETSDNWKPIGTGEEDAGEYDAFHGTFDGNGHTIVDLNIQNNDVQTIGLFGYTQDATLKNIQIKLRNGSLTGSQYAGTLAGRAFGGTISNCRMIVNNISADCAGGLVGENSADISNCNVVSLAGYYEISGNTNAGGLVGKHTSGTIATSFVSVAVGGSGNKGGFIGEMNGGSIANSYFNTDLASLNVVGNNPSATGITGKTASEMVTKSTFSGFNFNTVWNICENEKMPFQQVFREDGSSCYPYKIRTAKDLDNLRAYDGVLESESHFALANDIDLSDFTDEFYDEQGWLPIGYHFAPFNGFLHGNGHKITGLRINRPQTDNVGLFGFSERGGIDSLDVVVHESGSIIGKNNVGILAGTSEMSLTAVSAMGNVSGETAVGGLVGNNDGANMITNNAIFVHANVSGTNDVGGAFGRLGGNVFVENAYVSGTVSGMANVGGFVGQYLEMKGQGAPSHQVYTIANVNGTSNTGAFIGYLNGNPDIQNCYFNTETSGQTNAVGNTSHAGISGKTTAEMKQSATFANWDFSKNWMISENKTFPYFPHQSAPANLTALALNFVKGTRATDQQVDSLIVYKYTKIGNFPVMQKLGTLRNPDTAWQFTFPEAMTEGDVLMVMNYEHNKAIAYPQIVPIRRFTATVTGTSNGTITPNTPASLLFGESAQFTFLPDTGFTIDSIVLNGNNIGRIYEYTFSNMTSDNQMHVYFGRLQYIVNAVADSGSIISPSGDSTLIAGDSICYTIAPKTGYEILRVRVNRADCGKLTSYTFKNIQNYSTIAVESKKKTYPIIATTDEHGEILPSGRIPVEHGSNQEFSFNPKIGYTLDSLIVNNQDATSMVKDGIYTFKNVTDSHNIRVVYKSTLYPQYTITASVEYGGIINPSGISVVDSGTNKSYAITPNSGYKIAQISIDGINDTNAVKDAAYVFANINNNHTIDVVFEEIVNIFVINASADEHGSITPSGEVKVRERNNQSFTITPDFGYAIDKVWVNGGDSTHKVINGAYTFSHVKNDYSIHVVFKSLNFPQYPIEATAGSGGSISPSGTVMVDSSDNKTFTFTADEGYRLFEVLIDGFENTQAVYNGSYTFTNVSGAHTVVANFEPAIYTVSASVSGGNGSISPVGDSLVNMGATIAYTFVPNSGYKLQRVLIDNVNNEEAVSDGFYTFENIASSHTIVAFFEKITSVKGGKSGEILVYPNPTKGKLTIDNGQLTMKEQVKVYNGFGVCVAQYSSNGKETEIDLSHLAPGIYFIGIGNERVKIIKQ